MLTIYNMLLKTAGGGARPSIMISIHFYYLMLGFRPSINTKNSSTTLRVIDSR